MANFAKPDALWQSPTTNGRRAQMVMQLIVATGRNRPVWFEKPSSLSRRRIENSRRAQDSRLRFSTCSNLGSKPTDQIEGALL